MDPGRAQKIRSFLLLHSLGITITVCTFVFDLMTPLGVAAAVPYSLLVLLSLRSPSLGLTWFAALSASALTIAGYFLSPPGDDPWVAEANRGLALFVIWMTAYLVFTQKRNAAKAERDRMALLQSEQLASLGEVAAGVAHELGNPLAALQGRIESLEAKLSSSTPDLDAARHTTGILRELAERMVQIIRAMRSLSRDASSDPFQGVPLARLIDDVLALSRDRFRKLGVEIQRGEIPEDLEVPCRETQVGQVLVNLINNAADAVAELPERWIRIDVEADAEEVRISVTDSGKGIPADIQDKIMRPFFTTKDVGRGTGLGLPISKSMVESHSGRLWLDRSAAHTRFVFALPRRQTLTC